VGAIAAPIFSFISAAVQPKGLPGLAPAGDLLSWRTKVGKEHCLYSSPTKRKTVLWVPCATPFQLGLFRQHIHVQSEKASASCLAPSRSLRAVNPASITLLGSSDGENVQGTLRVKTRARKEM
jgi:hypothetical protein